MIERPASVGRGIWLVAQGRTEGIGCFRGTARAFITTLVPMVSLAMVASVWLLMLDKRHDAAAQLLSAPAAVLAGPVASHFVAVRLGREANWARYATAANWLQWFYLMLVLLALALWTTGFILAPIVGLAVLVYAIWLQLFLARSALALDWPRAVLVVLAVAAANFVFVFVPTLLVALITRLGG